MKKCEIHNCKQRAVLQIESHGKFYQVCEECFGRIKRLKWDQRHYGEELLAEMGHGHKERMVR